MQQSISRIEKRARAKVSTAKENALEDKYLALGLVAIILSSVATSFTPLVYISTAYFYILVLYCLDNSASP